MLSKHDEALLADLRLQPVWLLIAYLVLGVVAASVGLVSDGPSAKLLCVGGGFLIALGAEKIVSRRIRNAAVELLEAKQREVPPGAIHS